MAGPNQFTVSSILRPFAWLAGRLATFALMVVLAGCLFVASLAFEVTTVALSRVAEAVLGQSFITSVSAENLSLKKQKAKLVKRVDVLEGRNADLTRENRLLTEEVKEVRTRNESLSEENRRLHTDNQRLEADGKRLRAKNKQLADKAKATVANIDRRSTAVGTRMVRTATRNVASIPLESVPVVGGVTIALVTALEISDACAMMNEVQDLRGFAGLPRQDSVMNNICSLVPIFPVEARYQTARECREHHDELKYEYGDTSPEVASVVGEICRCLEDVAKPNKDVCYPQEAAEMTPR